MPWYHRDWKVPWARILASASQFIEAREERQDLTLAGSATYSAHRIAQRLATGIYYIGRDESGARKKVWMFMQGMVRGAPDLAVWQHAINSADLGVPLDTNTGAAFLDLRTPYLERLLHDNDLSYELDERGKMASTAGNIEAVTRVARWLFSKDPARVDYAFFCCGRHHSPGSDHHRCWTYVNCSACSLRSLVRCKERRA